MTPRKPSPHLLTVWRLRLFLAALAPSFLSAFFFFPHWWWWRLFTLGWAGTFLICYLGYLPLLFRKLSFSWEEDRFTVRCGVFYSRLRAVNRGNVQTVCLASTPLERLFGLRSLRVYAAGATLTLPGLPLKEALELQRALTPPPPEGGDPLA